MAEDRGSVIPDCDIKVTPRMIHAALMAMLTHDENHFSWEEIGESICRAVLLAKLQDDTENAA